MVLLIRSESWAMLEVMMSMVELTHIGFLGHIKGNRECITADGTWTTPKTGVVLRVSGIHGAATYIGQRQGRVAQWVTLGPIFNVCAREKGFEGQGRWRRPWCRRETTYEISRATMVEALR